MLSLPLDKMRTVVKLLALIFFVHICSSSCENLELTLESYLENELLNGELKDILFSDSRRNEEHHRDPTLRETSSHNHHRIVHAINKYMEHHLLTQPLSPVTTPKLRSASSFLEVVARSRQKLRSSASVSGPIKESGPVCQRRLNYYLSNCALGPPVRKVNDLRLAA